jgi:hypothetical protein
LRAEDDFFAAPFLAVLRPAFFAAAIVRISVRWDGVLPIPRWTGETAWGKPTRRYADTQQGPQSSMTAFSLRRGRSCEIQRPT